MVGIRQPEEKRASILLSVTIWLSERILDVARGRADHPVVVLPIEVVDPDQTSVAVLTKKHEG